MVYESIYKKLIGIIGAIEQVPEHMKLISGAYMPLSVERLSQDDKTITLSLTHYFKMNGDLVPDPDMEIKIYPAQRMAEAMTYQDQFGYRSVYPEPGMVNLRAKKELNSFLLMWLRNLKAQGFNKDRREA